MEISYGNSPSYHPFYHSFGFTIQILGWYWGTPTMETSISRIPIWRWTSTRNWPHPSASLEKSCVPSREARDVLRNTDDTQIKSDQNEIMIHHQNVMMIDNSHHMSSWASWINTAPAEFISVSCEDSGHSVVEQPSVLFAHHLAGHSAWVTCWGQCLIRSKASKWSQETQKYPFWSNPLI
jgi:hypothetical protein